MGQTAISGRCYGKNGEYNVVDFGCAKSRHVGILHTLSNMCRKLSAGFGLHVDRVPVVYHWITRLVLDRMREHKPYLRLEKCEFEETRIEYLGVIISHNKVEMDPIKITGVADWLTPSNKKKVQSFVGLVNFYQRFIPGFSHHARAHYLT
jgi:hypothetical protein